MDADKVVTAIFAAIPTYNLTVNVSPDGSGSVTVDPDASEYDTGTVVTLTPTNASGYEFTGWIGDVTSYK